MKILKRSVILSLIAMNAMAFARFDEATCVQKLTQSWGTSQNLDQKAKRTYTCNSKDREKLNKATDRGANSHGFISGIIARAGQLQFTKNRSRREEIKLACEYLAKVANERNLSLAAPITQNSIYQQTKSCFTDGWATPHEKALESQAGVALANRLFGGSNVSDRRDATSTDNSSLNSGNHQ